MLHPETPRNLPPESRDEDEARARDHRQLCTEMLTQMAAGNVVAPFPFGDALHLLDGLGQRRHPPYPGPRRGWFRRLIASLCLTGAPEARGMEPRGGGGSGGDGRSLFAGLPVRDLHA